MKITGVRAHCLASELETPFAFSQGWVKRRGACIVEVQTDAGLTGWGEALCQGLQPPQIAACWNVSVSGAADLTKIKPAHSAAP